MRSTDVQHLGMQSEECHTDSSNNCLATMSYMHVMLLHAWFQATLLNEQYLLLQQLSWHVSSMQSAHIPGHLLTTFGTVCTGRVSLYHLFQASLVTCSAELVQISQYCAYITPHSHQFVTLASVVSHLHQFVSHLHQLCYLTYSLTYVHEKCVIIQNTDK